MPLTVNQIQNAYVAFFNRPADTAGLNYWSSYAGDATALLNTFALSAEYTSLYAGMNNTQIVNTVYGNLFGRDADLPGLNYWVGQLTAGNLKIGNIADAINKGAQGVDATAVANKTTAATAFTNSLDTVAKVIAYSSVSSSGLAAVKTWLSGVTTTASLTTATSSAGLTAITSTVSSNVSATGQTFTLTTSADSSMLVGSSGTTSVTGNDTFNTVVGTNGLVANGSTLNPGDNLSGGAGSDTLAISVSGTHTGADLTVSAVTLNNIETITVSDFQTDNAFDTIINLSLASDVTTIAQVSSSASGDTGFTGVKNIVAAKLQNGAGDLSITYADTAVVGTADTQTLELNAVTAGTFTAAATATGGIETLAITSTGSAANVLSGITNAASLKTITVGGTQDVTLGTLGAAVITVNASASTAGVIASATTAVDYVITGGAGNDVLTVTAGNITAADTITGGNGTDTIVLGAVVTAANMANVTGFEVLEESTNNVAQTVDGLLSGVTKLVSSAASDAGANTVSFTNVGSAVTDLQVTGTEGIIATLKTNGTADAVTLTYGTSTAGFTVAGQTTLNDYETISIVSQGGANNTGAFGANQVATLNARGSQALTIGATTAAALATINASSMTANFIMTDNSSTVASTITGGAGNDTLFGGTKVDVIVGGAANDVINGGASADNLSGGDGNDTFNVTTVTDFTTGVETVVGGAGNDTLSIAQAATVTTITALNLGAISGIETLSINSSSAAASVTLTDAVYTANGQTLSIVDGDLTTAGGTLTVDGSALTGTNSISVTANTATGINDTLTGGAGNDTFTFSTVAGLEATDTVVGGAGTDTISLTATAAVTAVLTGVRTVENVTTTGTGGNISITVGSDSVIAASSTLTTSAASSTTTGNTLTYDGSAVTTATKVQNVTGTSGNDGITGGTGNDIISGGDGTDAITGGAGIDNLSGGAGVDTFTVATAAQFIGLAAAETVSGGSGNDILSFAAGVGFTVAAADLAAINSIETIQFLSTTNNDTLTLSDSVFTANGVTALKIDAATVTTGDFILSASGLSAANSVEVTRTGDNNAGSGDNIVMGAGNDTLLVRIDMLDNTTTTLTGGTGTDTLTLSTAATATMTTLVTGFERINFGADIAASVTTVDQNVAADVTFTVDGTALITANALTFNGAAELDGKFSITGGSGADALTGGLLADTISGGVGADTITGGGGADSLTGGTGADVFAYTSASVAHSTGSAADTITDFATTSDKISVTLNYSAVSAAVDVNTVLVATTGDLSAKRGEFVYDSTAGTVSINVNNDNLVTTQDIKINVGATVASGDLIFNITGSAFGDVIVGGAGLDTIVGGVGADSITGGNGADVITAGTSAGSAIRYAATTFALMASEGGDTINGFGVMSGTNDDVFNFATGLLSNGTSNAQDVVTAGGTIGANDVVLIATDAIAGAQNMATAAGALASFNLSYTTQTNLADGDRILYVASGTGATTADTYMWLVSKGAGTLAAADLTLVGIIVGLADAVAADLGADGLTITTLGAHVSGTDFFTIA